MSQKHAIVKPIVGGSFGLSTGNRTLYMFPQNSGSTTGQQIVPLRMIFNNSRNCSSGLFFFARPTKCVSSSETYRCMADLFNHKPSSCQMTLASAIRKSKVAPTSIAVPFTAWHHSVTFL